MTTMSSIGWRMVMYRRKTIPPFAGQIDHEVELGNLCEELIRLRRTERDEQDAEALIVGAVQQRPLDTYLILRHGQFLAGAGRPRDAIDVYRKALDTRPFDMRIRVALAQLLAQGTMKDEAVKILTSRDSPDRYGHKDALLLLGAHCAASGNIAEAAAIYEELGRIDPRNVDVLTNQAAAALSRNDLAAMKQYLDKALALAPDSVEALTNMGNYFVKQKQPRAAQEWFAQADPSRSAESLRPPRAGAAVGAPGTNGSEPGACAAGRDAQAGLPGGASAPGRTLRSGRQERGSEETDGALHPVQAFTAVIVLIRLYTWVPCLRSR